MRRVFVICLILLFPLNVLALSLSAATLQWAGAPAHADAASAAPATAFATPVVSPIVIDNVIDKVIDNVIDNAADDHGAGFDCRALCDLDPDEPPSGADFHDSVNKDSRAQFLHPPGWAAAPTAPAHHGRSSAPPTKPPPIA